MFSSLQMLICVIETAIADIKQYLPHNLTIDFVSFEVKYQPSLVNVRLWIMMEIPADHLTTEFIANKASCSPYLERLISYL